MDIDIKVHVYSPPKMISSSLFLSNICFMCVKETSQGGVSFMHTKHECIHVLILVVN